MNITFFTGDIIMDASMFLFFGVFLFVIIILVTAFQVRPKKYADFSPPITILIPAYNEEKNIKKCLEHILANKYGKQQIIVIDDGSTDKTASIVKKLQEKHKEIKLITGNHEGKSQALNLGLKVATHEIIVSIDADTFIDKNFLKEIVKPFHNQKVGATNAVCLAYKPKNVLEWFQSVEYVYNNFVRLTFSNVFGNGIWFFGAAAAYKKSVVQQLNGFSTQTMTEDMDMSLAIFGAGYEVLMVRDATYYTTPPHSLKELFKQRMRWFYGGIQNIIKHKKVFKRDSFAIKFLFGNQVFWSVYSLLIIPIVIYQVAYWMPSTFWTSFWYLFRWFSLLGPIVVLKNLPIWGLNFVNIFGVTAGIFTTILIGWSFSRFKEKFHLRDLIVIFFYFPYTLLLNATFLVAALKFPFSQKKYFKK